MTSKARCVFTAALAAGFVSTVTPAYASENGTQHYPVGASTVVNGILPPPGMLQLQDYQQFYSADELVDGHGKKIPGVDFKIGAQVNAPRFLYTWKIKPIFGYFNLTTGLVTPIVHVRGRVDGVRQSQFGLGDVTLQNYLAHVSADHKLFWWVGVETWLPTGRYDKNRLANTGLNYFAFSPDASVTYMPSKRWDIGAQVYTELNTKNKATGYHTGTNFTIDYGASVRFKDSLVGPGLGIQGYFYKQIQDDTVDGIRVGPKGNRGQVFAIGPQFRYDFAFGGVIMKYQRELAVENRPRGDRFWIEFGVPLTGRPR